jgi:hypothetical protein
MAGRRVPGAAGAFGSNTSSRRLLAPIRAKVMLRVSRTPSRRRSGTGGGAAAKAARISRRTFRLRTTSTAAASAEPTLSTNARRPVPVRSAPRRVKYAVAPACTTTCTQAASMVKNETKKDGIANHIRLWGVRRRALTM